MNGRRLASVRVNAASWLTFKELVKRLGKEPSEAHREALEEYAQRHGVGIKL